VQRDEARHTSYGVYLLQRLIAGEPALWDSVTARMNDLLPKTMGVIGDVFTQHGDDVPFGLNVAERVMYASEQFNQRLNAIERAVTQQAT
jgi:ribonucleoside-diphosphate reductase beta chain